jgi:hypothetical protein
MLFFFHVPHLSVTPTAKFGFSHHPLHVNDSMPSQTAFYKDAPSQMKYHPLNAFILSKRRGGCRHSLDGGGNLGEVGIPFYF